MTRNWQIREAVAEDATALAACMKSAYTPYRDRLGSAQLPPMEVDYLAEIEHYPVWVAESDGNILGGLVMTYNNDRASIANIAVNPLYQGQGIGGALMRFAESDARQRGFSELGLATHVLLEENLSLYRHLGWQETGRDATRVHMKKSL